MGRGGGMNRLQGKRALVTGGSSGIGLETAKQFVAEGARVAITGRSPEALESAKREMGEGALYIHSDAGDVSSQKDLAERVRKEFGKLDILFLNAGIAELKPVDQWDEAAYDRTF